jgi:hypothetical protein
MVQGFGFSMKIRGFTERVANKFEGNILPHIMQKLREDSYNLDIEVITSSPKV